ncbi:MarR family winged helix-turn-helix transcriptional regulator [Sphaerisporangium corydalis]|uniref:MarR family winged helix-turn-helix transcriptional regulator n=1 Tax=Sphaerisporangium corydalis TaxID=1441875 RepID=A0ABV9EIQ3_9ACTN|nr:MarR family winged helix-turn-helix transcriptional regulator [Sphaerisporangium corydalis]
MPEALDDVVMALSRLIRALGRARTHDMLTQEAGVQIERPAEKILGSLRVAGEPRRIGAIADELQVESPHVTRHVAVLERRGYVERVADPHDRRASLIRLTPIGEDAADRCRGVTGAWFDAALRNWPEEDRKELIRLVPKLADDLDAHFQRLYDLHH